MQAFIQSNFLQSLAYALIGSIWQMGLLWAITVVLMRSFTFSASQKFKIAFTAQLAGLVIFIVTLINAYEQHVTVVNTNAVAGDYTTLGAWINQCMPYLALIYLAMFIYQVSRLLVAYRFTKNLRRNDLRKIRPEFRVFVQEMSELFSLHRKVRIYLSGKIRCPLTIGFFKPVILIPFAAINNLTIKQVEAVILHELAHIKRADYLLFLLQSIVDKIFFFNIFSKMLGDIIERERENACDDWVLQFKYNSMHYAEALLKLGRLQTSASLAMAASGKKQSLLLARIKRLMHRSDKKLAYNFHSLLFSFLAFVIAFGMMASFPVKTPKHKTVAVIKRKPEASNGISNQEVAVIGLTPEAKRSIENSRSKLITPSSKTTTQEIIRQQIAKTVREQVEPVVTETAKLVLDPDYLINVNMNIDSLTAMIPDYDAALNKQFVLTPEVYQQALSYSNFRRLERMLALTGDSIKVTESGDSEDSYKKLITIETTDKSGNKHVYNLVVELYQ